MIARAPFGFTQNGDPVEAYTLSNSHGMEVTIVTYGATIVSLHAPDAAGRASNVVLSRRDLAEYETASGHYGATIGRYANRIANGRFTLDGNAYQLSINRPPNTLHGGFKGFDKKIWSVQSASGDASGAVLALRYVSAGGEEGFPGRLTVDVTFTLDDANALAIDYAAVTDADTVVNFTNHSYFNLTGDPALPVTSHELQITASAYTPVDATLIPTGEIAPVAGTALDFRAPRAIGESGHDLNWVLDRESADELVLAARAYEPQNGRVLEVFTTEPGLQFYSAPGLNGFALETQHFPDSPNHPQFPSTVLRAGERFVSRTVLGFGFGELSRPSTIPHRLKGDAGSG